MKLHPRIVLPILLAAMLPTGIATAADTAVLAEAPDEGADAVLKLIKITATVDGTGRIVFTRQGVHYEHRTWAKPTNVTFAGEPWANLSSTPAAWSSVAAQLDLTRAWIAKRKGRDTIALEQTADGFDLYLCDAPNGTSQYEVTLAIPRVPGGREKVAANAPATREKSNPQGNHSVLEIQRDGSIVWNRKRPSREELIARLRELSDLFPDYSVVLRAEDGTAFKEIQAALNLCKTARIWNVSFTSARGE